jgi:hypothetical protein
MRYSNTIQSNCHCGNIRLELHTNRSPSEFTPRICQCTLCRKHNASWISDPEGEAKLHIENKDSASFYRFGLKTADFIICKICGVLMIAVCEIKGRHRAVLNSTAMINHVFAVPMLTDFDGENVESRLARREQNWTGNVIISVGNEVG